ncbi:MAG: 23S rRNA (adenine(2503)-C(2))-methyltransferase RlmN [Clostridia bacterium]|nr:23S rRNA (adenine(2503)-C(2))-methyltransferase RlmN [Clostridia bacterium]
MEDILNYTRKELNSLLEEGGFPVYRSKQIYQWLYTKYVNDVNQMNNLPVNLRQWLINNYNWRFPKAIREQVSKIDGTAKFLVELVDEQTIETVLMFHGGKAAKQRKTLCVSSQVGCPVGCVFCATGKMGLKRNLSTGEIIGQLLAVSRVHGKIDNIVYMGMGEPLLNYDNVLKSIRIITDEMGLNFSSRKITISTCGLAPEIKKLSEEKIPLTLAISLHAANNELRNALVPINKKYPLEDLLGAVKYFINKTNRKVTFEYILAKDINDSILHAKELAALLKGFLCNVNIIPANPVPGTAIKKPNARSIANFVQILQSKGIETVVRSEKGADIDGACGQLKARTNGND